MARSMSLGTSNHSADPPLVRFFDPVAAGKDNRGRTLSQLLAWTDFQLEKVHHYIQFLFPLVVPSVHNRTAFVIDRATLIAFRQRPELRARLKESFLRILRFYGLQLVDSTDGGMAIRRGHGFADAARNWITLSNHNYLRITRIISSLRILGLETEAQAFYLCLQEEIYARHQDRIGARTMQFWTDAATKDIGSFSAAGTSNTNDGNFIHEVLTLMEHQEQVRLQQQLELQKQEEELRTQQDELCKLADQQNEESSKADDPKADNNEPEYFPVVQVPVQNGPANSSYDVVFGVEMKMVIVMHERLIIEQLTSGSYIKGERQAEIYRRICKDVLEGDRRKLCRAPGPYIRGRSRYLSWAILTPPGVDDLTALYRDDRKLRTYGLEPLEIAREVLRSSQQIRDGSYWNKDFPDDLNVNVYPEREARTDYDQWCLIPAHEVEAVRRPTLKSYLRYKKRCFARDRLASANADKESEDEQPPSKRIKTIHYTRKTFAQASQARLEDPLGNNPDTLEWDTYGVELVSNLLHPTQAQFNNISDVCDKLKGIPCNLHGAIPAPKDGLHIHLKPAQSDFDILTLQHLAYILIMYEPYLNALFPPHRRTESGSDASNNELHPISYPLRVDIKTNQELSFRAWGDKAGVPSNQVIRWSYQGLPHARKHIFTTGTDVFALWKLLGARQSAVVDFSPLIPKGPRDAPHTVEFRQHESVLCADMIRHWALFCTALVRYANKNAHFQPGGPDVHGAGYTVEEWRDTMSVWDLIDELELGEEARAYWRRRGAYLAAMARFPPLGRSREEDRFWYDRYRA